MSQDLFLVDITDTNPVPFGRLQSGEILLGRSGDVAVSLPSEAVSFEHGVLVHMRGRWFYKDLESTNGSWLNGHVITPGRWKLVRDGDLLQVGDRVLRLEGHGEAMGSYAPPNRQRVLLVFKEGELIDEFPLPDSGEALIVGGVRGDIELARSESPRSVLTFEVGARGLVVRSDAGLLIVVKNEVESILPTSIGDRDEIDIEDYVIVCHNPQPRETSVLEETVHSGEGQGKAMFGSIGSASWDSWGGEGGASRDVASSREGRPRFGELAHDRIGNEQWGAEEDEKLAGRFLGTGAGGVGRPLAHDVSAFLPPPPPVPPGFFSTTEGKWVVISLAFLLFSGLAVAVLLWTR